MRRLTYPSRVKQMLTKRSAPHPATMKTPTGGTVSRQQTELMVVCRVNTRPLLLTEDCDEDHEEGGDGFRHGR